PAQGHLEAHGRGVDRSAADQNADEQPRSAGAQRLGEERALPNAAQEREWAEVAVVPGAASEHAVAAIAPQTHLRDVAGSGAPEVHHPETVHHVVGVSVAWNDHVEDRYRALAGPERDTRSAEVRDLRGDHAVHDPPGPGRQWPRGRD